MTKHPPVALRLQLWPHIFHRRARVDPARKELDVRGRRTRDSLNRFMQPIDQVAQRDVRRRADLDLPSGLDCDTDLRIRREDGRSFTNLYGIGEVIGSRPLHGFSYVSGMTVTPAIVFGHLLGERLATTVRATG